MHKNRGAPHGNHNALKHGFYSSAFKQHERRLLNQLPIGSLSGEIELIRIASRRFLEALTENAAPLDVTTQLAALRALNLSAQSITALIRAQALSQPDGDSQALEELARRLMSSDHPFHPPSDP